MKTNLNALRVENTIPLKRITTTKLNFLLSKNLRKMHIFKQTDSPLNK